MINKELTEAIGSEMRRQRIIKKKTLQEVGNYLGLSKNTISYYELGKIAIHIDMLNEYCNYLGINYITLLQTVQNNMHRHE